MSAMRTFRGRELDELLQRIRAELGPDAVIVAQREDAEGGVGGFFAKRVIEVDAVAGAFAGGRLDVVADEPAMPGVPEALEAVAEGPLADEVRLPDPQEPTFEAHLKALLGAQAEVAPPAPEVRPLIVPSVDAAPTVEPIDIADVARAFAAAPIVEDEPPVVEHAVEPEPEPERPQPQAVATRPAAQLPALTPLVPTEVTDRDTAWEALVEAGIGATLAADVVDETVTHLLPFASEPALKPLVQRALAGRIPIHATRGASGRVIGFVGPGGSGKTRCAARLAAAYASRTTTPVACVTLRPKDGGAELRDLLTGSGVEVHAEADAQAAAARVERLRETSLVVLDTPAVSPRAEAEMRVLAVELAQLRVDEVHLTMPATIAPRPARELVDGTRPLHVCAIALTHTDETDALGTVVDAAIDTGLPLSFIGRGQSVKTGLVPADAHDLATVLLP